MAQWPLKSLKTEGCKNRTYINTVLVDYIKSRDYFNSPARMAIMPFDVPANFARPGYEHDHFGRELARQIQAELHKSGEVPVIELFDQNSWPGKREEFFAGNYGAIERARHAGYDLVFIGFMDELKNDEDMIFYTKIIDTTRNVTIWFAKTLVYTRDRSISKALADTQMLHDRPDLFNFPERAERFGYCVVDYILKVDTVPG